MPFGFVGILGKNIIYCPLDIFVGMQWVFNPEYWPFGGYFVYWNQINLILLWFVNSKQFDFSFASEQLPIFFVFTSSFKKNRGEFL